MICPDCGQENKEGAKFCKNCGASISGVQKDIPKENAQEVKPSSSNLNNAGSSDGNKNVLIICATVVICVAIIAAALLLLNSGGQTVANDVAVNDSSDSVDVSTSEAKNSSSSDSSSTSEAKNSSSSDSSSTSVPKGSGSSSSSSADVMTYSEAENYLSGASYTVISNTFDEADANDDGVLTGSEISRYKYLADLTDRTADTSNTEHVEAQDYGAGDGTTKTRYCTTHGRVAVGDDNRCPYCEAEGLDSRTVKGSTEYI